MGFHLRAPASAASSSCAHEIPLGVGQGPEGYDGHVTFYVEVSDVEAALAQAESLGGKRRMGPDQVPGGLTLGHFTDPEGNMVGLTQAA